MSATQATGVVQGISENGAYIKIEVKREGIRDEDVVTCATPGWEKIKNVNKGDKVRVTVEIIPPRTSTQTHLVIKEIVGRRTQ